MHMSVSLCDVCVLNYFDQIWLIEIFLDFKIFKYPLLSLYMTICSLWGFVIRICYKLRN